VRPDSQLIRELTDMDKTKSYVVCEKPWISRRKDEFGPAAILPSIVPEPYDRSAAFPSPDPGQEGEPKFPLLVRRKMGRMIRAKCITLDNSQKHT